MPPGHGPMRQGFLTEEEKKNQPKVTEELLKRVLSYIKPYYKQALLALLCVILSSSLAMMPSILTGKIIDEGLIGRNLDRLVYLIVLSLVLTLIANVIGVLESYLNNWMAQHITYDMRNQMFQHLQMMSHRFFTTHNQGDIITRMTSDISGVESVISNTFSSILSNSITLVVAVIAMFQKNWILTLVGLLIVPLFVLPTRKAGKTRWALTNESQAVHDEINGILNETMSVSGQLLVKLFNRENYEYERYKKANHDMIQLNIKESMAGRWFRVILTSFSSIGPMALYFVGGVLMMKYDSSLTVGDITVLVALLSRMYGPVNSLLNIQVDWIRSMALFTRIFDYYDMELEITNSPNAIHPLTARGEIEVKHVDFSYEEGKQILSDINFNLPYGHSVALVGPSGSGKSTVINLIARLYDVDRGAIMFDGVDIRDLDLHFLRKNVGIVTQDSYLFNGTIKDNLLYAKSDASEEELVEACQKAQIYDFIKKQEKGFDTEVGNRGLKLSGGEKQRLSIARIILKDPALFIFDEATSALDSLSEDKIQKAIEPIIESKTSILIAHRLSTILSADEILVIKDGHIVERGTHQSLLKLHGVYKELYDTQYKENKS